MAFEVMGDSQAPKGASMTPAASFTMLPLRWEGWINPFEAVAKQAKIAYLMEMNEENGSISTACQFNSLKCGQIDHQRYSYSYARDLSPVKPKKFGGFSQTPVLG